MRTYYSYQVPKSFDKSYNLELMGLWGWAELAIGIIVGCLPVTPKFFQHVGPKVLNVFASVSKSDVQSDMSPTYGSKVKDEILLTHQVPAPEVPAPFRQIQRRVNGLWIFQ